MNISSKRVLAALTAAMMVSSLAACGSSGSGESGNGGNGGNGGGEEETTTTTTTAKTVEVKTEPLSQEDADKLGSALDTLSGELTNKTIKWCSFYDSFHATSSGNTKAVSLELFERKYGGEIEVYLTDWNSFNDFLAQRLVGGEGIDFCPGEDITEFPSGIVAGKYVSFDEYVDFSDPIWSSVKGINDKLELKGKHYVICTSSDANYVVIYNRQTLDTYGFDDPSELLDKGEWNWDTFKSMLVEYCDPEAGNYGLDNWFNEKPLIMTTGKNAVDLTGGRLVHHLTDPDIERVMNFEKELFDNSCVLDKNLTGWNVHAEYIAEGKELFYIGGLYEMTADQEIWSEKFGLPDDVMFVPLPKDPEADKYYIPSKPAAFMLCKGGQNPEGVARFAECCIAANLDPGAREVSDDKYRNDYGWTEEMITMRNRITDMSTENPVYDILQGCPKDLYSILDSSDGLRGPMQAGTDWATIKDSILDTIDLLVDEFNTQLDAMG